MEVLNTQGLDNLQGIKAIIFDWDGVFHSGYKFLNGESQFSEADSMGINMLRLAYYLKFDSIPYTAIVTGENNPTGQFLANREHLDAIFYKVKDKKIIADYLQTQYNILPHEILFGFDDILDLSLAKVSGSRFFVKRDSSKFLKDFIIKNGLTDFITINDGSQHAVREVSEFVIHSIGMFDETLNTRIEHGEIYKHT